MHRRRYWIDARNKCDIEGRCRVCKAWGVALEAAHVIGRASDAPTNLPGYDVYVDPASVIPLCRSCHQAYDAHEIDVLPVLKSREQTQAVEDAGGIETARRRVAPSAYRVAVG